MKKTGQLKSLFGWLHEQKSVQELHEHLESNRGTLEFILDRMKSVPGRELISDAFEYLKDLGVFSVAEFNQSRREFLAGGVKASILLGSSPLIAACAGVGASLGSGYPYDPILGPTISQGTEGHGFGALDYRIPEGTPVTLSAPGICNLKIEDSGRWNFEHKTKPELNSKYGHMMQFILTMFKEYPRGVHLGYSGNVGRSTGPHLHWEVADNNLMNPIPETLGFGGGPIVVYDQVAQMDIPNDDYGLRRKERLEKEYLDKRIKELGNKRTPSGYLWLPGPKDAAPFIQKYLRLTSNPIALATELRNDVMKKRLFSYGHPIYTLFLEVNAWIIEKYKIAFTHAVSPTRPLT